MNLFKYLLMLITYFWLRLDPILYVTFRKDWTPRFEFMANIFGEEDTEKFLRNRVSLVKARNKTLPPVILVKEIDKLTDSFLGAQKLKRTEIIDTLIFWAMDKEINEFNIDSYKTRQAIVWALTGIIFQNSLAGEIDQNLLGLKRIVFSRVTYLGAKGEPSPDVHEAIISGTAKIFTGHISALIRQREEKLDKLTKIKLIKEIHKSKSDGSSLAFSADIREDDEFKQKFPLPVNQAKLLWEILSHYRYSAWPDSRERTEKVINKLTKQLGFPLDELFA